MKIILTNNFIIILVTILCLCTFAYLTLNYVAGSEGGNKIRFYGCVKYISIVHCDPLHNNVTGFRYSASSVKIYELSNDAPFFIEGKFGKALNMRAPYREAIHVPTLSNLTFNHFSVSFWVEGKEDAEPLGQIISYTDSRNTAGWFFDMSNGNKTGQSIRFVVTQNSGNPISPPDVHLRPDTFHHIVGTFDGSSVKIYSDGQFAGETKYSGNYTGDARLPLTIGSSSYCASCNRWSGAIDDLRIYGKVLDETEIAKVFANTNDPNVPGLIAHWTFDGQLADSSGNKNHGTQSTLLSSMAYAPDGRLFFAEKNTGEIRIMKDLRVLPEPFVKLDDYLVSWEQGLLGMTIDPKFSENHFVYLYYTSNNENGTEVFNRVVRFTDDGNKATNEVVLLDKIFAEKGYHSGGALAFGPDDKLYITVGDATEHPFAQDTSILIGKVLRINRDGTVPPDNPFPNSPVYTYGHRNMYGIAFDKYGNGLVSENGDYFYDEINLIKKGGNYGFPTQQPANISPELSNSSASILPLRTYWDTIAPTQMIYYTGDKYPLLKNKFLLGTYQGDIYALNLDNRTKQITEENKIDFENYPFKPIIGVAKSPDGSIFFGAYNIWRLNSTDLTSKSQYLFPISFNTTSTITDVKFIPDQNKMKVGLSNNKNSSLTINIPKALMSNVASVLDNSNNKELQFVGSNNTEYNIVTTKIPNSPKFELSLLGSSIALPGEQILVG